MPLANRHALGPHVMTSIHFERRGGDSSQKLCTQTPQVDVTGLLKEVQ